MSVYLRFYGTLLRFGNKNEEEKVTCAISDVKNRRIDTVEPDKIRGGGFVKGKVLGFLTEFSDNKNEVVSQYMRNHFDARHFSKIEILKTHIKSSNFSE
ncbi:hypothetical protein B9Z55_011005 [Caenorhabditis nigoni]|uniref:Uncharacterized protein n=1 Tax=Caenorhabditis nigoni TaxID=1611254 RepID=A0A2G5UI79_9PELO|nr:hypothetical protein B9Z55_011005 [Caenorhabditis nigoni]